MVKVIPGFGGSNKMSTLLFLFWQYYSCFEAEFLMKMSWFTIQKFVRFFLFSTLML